MRLFTHKRHLHTLSHFFPPAFFPQVHVRTHTCTHTTAQSCNSLQSAAVPFRDERTTPCSENNWNQFKDTYYHSAPCLPPPPPPLLPLSPLSFFLSLSPRDLSLSFLQLPLFYFLSCTTWALQGCRHNLGHSAQPHFNQTRTHIHTRAITHLPLCVLPDTARWERLHYRVELWPCFDCLAREERCVRCVCESVCGREDRDRVKKKERKEASSWNEASLNVCVWTCLHICLCRCVCMCACRSGSGPVSNDTSGHY